MNKQKAVNPTEKGRRTQMGNLSKEIRNVNKQIEIL